MVVRSDIECLRIEAISGHRRRWTGIPSERQCADLIDSGLAPTASRGSIWDDVKAVIQQAIDGIGTPPEAPAEPKPEMSTPPEAPAEAPKPEMKKVRRATKKVARRVGPKSKVGKKAKKSAKKSPKKAPKKAKAKKKKAKKAKR